MLRVGLPCAVRGGQRLSLSSALHSGVLAQSSVQAALRTWTIVTRNHDLHQVCHSFLCSACSDLVDNGCQVN